MAEAHVSSCVMRVSDLDRSLRFYRDVFDCRVAIQAADMALLLTPQGFQLYLHARKSFRPRGTTAMGVQHLIWSTDTESDLDRIREHLRGYDDAVYVHTDAASGVTYLEGRGPDHERVIVTHPSPRELPRTVIAERLRS